MSFTIEDVILVVVTNAATLFSVYLTFRVRLEARLVRLETTVNLIAQKLGIYDADNLLA